MSVPLPFPPCFLLPVLSFHSGSLCRTRCFESGSSASRSPSLLPAFSLSFYFLLLNVCLMCLVLPPVCMCGPSSFQIFMVKRRVRGSGLLVAPWSCLLSLCYVALPIVHTVNLLCCFICIWRLLHIWPSLKKEPSSVPLPELFSILSHLGRFIQASKDRGCPNIMVI